MKKDSAFRFNISISKNSYKNKPTQADYSRMRWEKKHLTVSQFIERIRSGYSYCHIFYNNRRSNKCFIQSNIISIDIDKTDVCLADFVEQVQLKPTFAYETFSNGKDNKFSYRLVYVTEEPMNKLCFQQVYEKIGLMTGLSETRDHCGKVLAQLMNGTHSQAYIYRSNLIYSTITDLPVDATLSEQIIENESSLFPIISKNKNPNNNYNNIISPHTHKQYNCVGTNVKNRIPVLDSLLDELKETNRESFLLKYKHFYHLIRETKLDYNELGYTLITKDNLELYVRYVWRNKKCHINRFKDGEKRRNRLFIDGCIIRKIKPDISIFELFYNLLHRVYWYYDNTDGILSDSLIAQKAADVMEYDVDSMDFFSANEGKIKTCASYCKNNNIQRRSLAQQALKIERYT